MADNGFRPENQRLTEAFQRSLETLESPDFDHLAETGNDYADSVTPQTYVDGL